MFPARWALRPGLLEDLVGQGRRRGLAVGAGDADDLPLEEKIGQLDLRDDRDAFLAGGQDLRQGRDAGAGDDEVGLEEGLRAGGRPSRTTMPRLPPGPDLRREVRLGFLFGDQDAGAAREEEPAQGLAGPLEADDEDLLVRAVPCLSQFQGRQAEQGEDDAQDPEPDDDLLFLPAGKLEMMVEGGHLEDALALATA